MPADAALTEKWKDIPDYNGKYQASTEGNVRRVFRSGKTRKMTPYHKKMSGSQRMVVKLTQNGKSREEILISLIAKTFLGPAPPGMVPYHKNGMQSENYLNNIAYITKQELGKMTGARSRRKPVVKLDTSGQDVAYYRSARQAAKQNYMSYQTIIDRCNGDVKRGPAPDGFEYAWDDSEVSRRKAIRRMELAGNYLPPMPKAPVIEFDF
jgi:hypothetical protein